MSETTTATDAIRGHHDRFGVYYGPRDFSDHGPMAALALRGLGAQPAEVRRYLLEYGQRLRPLADAPEGYRDNLVHYLERVRTQGARAVLESELPGLISGWARDAYHPLIRLAYGAEFGIDEEVAAGLAYLRFCGADGYVAAAASTPARSDAAPAELFASMRAFAVADAPSFDAGLAAVLARRPFADAAPVIEQNLVRMTRTALDIFASTHDFFALHLVTGAYAFRTLLPFAGAHAVATFNAGLLAGYAAIGAPAFAPVDARARPPESSSGWLGLLGSDEHDIKLCYAATRLGMLDRDPAYARVAAQYLARSR